MPNIYNLLKDYGIGYTKNTDLNGNNYFYFDIEDYDKIKIYNWYFEKERGYIVTEKRINKKRTTIRLHRLITGLEDKDLFIDHINHNKYDNRKINLRIVTKSQNSQNRKIQSNNTTGYPGVYWDNDREKWTSYIKKDGNSKRIGRYKTFEEAVAARKEAENNYFGEYSYNNSIKLNVI